jgi:ferredoxin-like protein FixX
MTKVGEDVECMTTHVCNEGLSALFHRETNTKETTKKKKKKRFIQGCPLVIYRRKGNHTIFLSSEVLAEL